MADGSFTDLARKGLRNPRKAVAYLAAQAHPSRIISSAIPRSTLSGIELAVLSRRPFGTNVLDEDWELLIVLDTCRVDALRVLQSSNSRRWLTDLDISTRRSIGGSTLEWTAQTFREKNRDAVAEIDYVAGNMVVEDVLAGNQKPEDSSGSSWSPTQWNTLTPDDFNAFVSAWENRDVKGPDQGHVDRPHPSAETVTDFAIEHGRQHNPDRTIVHYIQPHYPYYAAAEADGRTDLESWERYPFPGLISRRISRDDVWNRYMTELESAIDSIGTLLNNFDADRVAITADHGEAFGEWFGYKHRGGTLHPKVRTVPWAETTATDQLSYEPELDVEDTEMNREEMLEALGYL